MGRFITNLRIARAKGSKNGFITPERIQALDEIGMNWQDVQDNQWEYGYSRARRYHETHGNLNVPTTYVDEEGFALGRWVWRHNEKRANGTTVIKLTQERRKRLEALGMVFIDNRPACE